MTRFRSKVLEPSHLSIYNARGVGGLVGGWVSLSHFFFPWAGEVVVSFDWARAVMGGVRHSVSCVETLVHLRANFNSKMSKLIG